MKTDNWLLLALVLDIVGGLWAASRGEWGAVAIGIALAVTLLVLRF